MRNKIPKTYTLNIDIIDEFDKKTSSLNKSQIIEDFLKTYNETH